MSHFTITWKFCLSISEIMIRLIEDAGQDDENSIVYAANANRKLDIRFQILIPFEEENTKKSVS